MFRDRSERRSDVGEKEGSHRIREGTIDEAKHIEDEADLERQSSINTDPDLILPEETERHKPDDDEDLIGAGAEENI